MTMQLFRVTILALAALAACAHAPSAQRYGDTITAGGLSRCIHDGTLTGNCTSGSPLGVASGGGGLFGAIISKPTIAGAGFAAWHTASWCAFSDAAQGILMDCTPGSTGDLSALYATPPAPPYTVTALVNVTYHNANQGLFGIGWSKTTSGTAEAQMIEFCPTCAGGFYQRIIDYAASGSSVALVNFGVNTPPYEWLRIKDDGTNVTFSWSFNGDAFFDLYTTTKAAGYLAGGYNYIIFGGDVNTGEGIEELLSWSVTSP